MFFIVSGLGKASKQVQTPKKVMTNVSQPWVVASFYKNFSVLTRVNIDEIDCGWKTTALSMKGQLNSVTLLLY